MYPLNTKQTLENKGQNAANYYGRHGEKMFVGSKENCILARIRTNLRKKKIKHDKL